jgi:uncharacterized protein YecE (DUF72 family)
MREVYVGMGGWSFPPWRDTFYPDDVSAKRELAYASSRVTAIEINATFYRNQSRDTFRRWHAETPDGFVFTIKASRLATVRKDLAAVADPVKQFLDQGLDELRDKLGPILWQLAPTKPLVLDEMDAFLALLPQGLRHAIEPRHASFRVPAWVELCRKHGVASVFTDSTEYPVFADRTAPFSYLRLVRADASIDTGYTGPQLDRVAAAARALAAGDTWELPTITDARSSPGPCYVFFINGVKERAPLAAQALIARLA